MTDHDDHLLEELRELYRTVDPVPEHLAEFSVFAVRVEQMRREMVELQKVATPEAAARSHEAEEREVVRTGTITFACEPVTVMINISRSPTGSLCVDGWIAPQAAYRVELYQPGHQLATESGEDGTFVLLDVPEGPSCLALRRSDGTGPTVCTPVIDL